MTSIFRRIVAGALVALGFALPASATTAGPDFTDLWFNPAESGWGINFIHQGNLIFATMFVYDASRAPHWFVADGMSGGGNAYSGALYQTSGPAYNGPWTGGVTAPAVGSISVNFASASTGTLSYTVSGQTITKQIQRQTVRSHDLSGDYAGGLSGRITGCTNPANNGLALANGLFRLTHSNSAAGGSVGIALSYVMPNGATQNCNFTGTYSPQGRVGSIAGNYSCSPSNVTGTFTISELEATRNGMNGTYSARDSLACNYSGYFGGLRDVPQ